MDEINQMLDMLDAFVKGIGEHATLIPNIAKTQRKLYEALLAEGFTKEQAMSVVTANNLFKASK